MYLRNNREYSLPVWVPTILFSCHVRSYHCSFTTTITSRLLLTISMLLMFSFLWASLQSSPGTILSMPAPLHMACTIALLLLPPDLCGPLTANCPVECSFLLPSMVLPGWCSDGCRLPQPLTTVPLFLYQFHCGLCP